MGNKAMLLVYKVLGFTLAMIGCLYAIGWLGLSSLIGMLLVIFDRFERRFQDEIDEFFRVVTKDCQWSY